MVMDLTGMEIANASLLDEATAAAEAMTMSRRISKNQSNVFFVDNNCHPQTLAVIRTRANFLGYEVVVGNPYTELQTREFFGVLIQYPASTGRLNDPSEAISQAHNKGALAVVASDLLALTQIKSPGEMDADVVVGNSQRFGVPMGYGGPHAAFFLSLIHI